MYRPISLSKNFRFAPLAFTLANTHIFQATSSHFSQTFAIRTKYFNISNTLFSLKSYFIFRKIILYFKIYQWQHCIGHKSQYFATVVHIFYTPVI